MLLFTVKPDDVSGRETTLVARLASMRALTIAATGVPNEELANTSVSAFSSLIAFTKTLAYAWMIS